MPINHPKRLPHAHPPAGFSLVEALLAAAILAVLTVAALQLFANLGRSHANLAGDDIAEQLVLDMILEIKQKAYADPDSPTSFGLEPGESLPRDTFDDVDDYFQYVATTPCLPDGAAYPQAEGLTRTVTVRRVAANDFSQTVSADEGFKEVTITVAKGQNLLAQHAYVIPYTP